MSGPRKTSKSLAFDSIEPLRPLSVTNRLDGESWKYIFERDIFGPKRSEKGTGGSRTDPIWGGE